MAPIIDCLKKGEFYWTLTATKAFANIKTKMFVALILKNHDFNKPFNVTCDATSVGKGGILS